MLFFLLGVIVAGCSSARPVIPLQLADLVNEQPGFAISHPSNHPANEPSQALLDVINGVLNGQEGFYGVAVENLATGETAFLNADEQFEAASLYKLPVMVEVFKEWREGSLSLDDELIVSEDAALKYDDGEPTMEIGSTVSVEIAVERMITFSDNTAAHVLLERLGVWNINQTMRELGLSRTEILSGERTSPRDMMRLMDLIANGQLIDQEASYMMLQLLLQQQVRDRLPALLPPDVPVANKTGNEDGVRNDVGIVVAPNGAYVIAVLAQDLVAGEQDSVTIARLSRAVYDYFNQGTP